MLAPSPPPPSKKNKEIVTKLRAVFLNPYKIMALPLSVNITVKYVTSAEGGIRGRQNYTKDNGAPFLSLSLR